MKRAELTTQQIITIIILIISFAVILFFIFRMNFGEIEKKEICHNSVLLKSKSVFGGEFDCQTNYVCISGGDDCEGFSYDTKIKIDFSKSDEEIKNQIFKAIADEMSDCWWMFGEGKVNYQGWGDKDNKVDWKEFHCAICSQIKFDKKIQDKFSSNFNYWNFYEYLSDTTKDKQQTYANYLYKVQKISASDLGKGIFENVKSEKEISFSEKYSVITGSESSAGKDEYILPYFVKSSEVSDKEIGCEVFDITGA